MSDGDGAWVADNLGCPLPASDVAAVGNADGSLTFYALVASTPKPAVMMKPETGAWTATPVIPDVMNAALAAVPVALQTGYDVENLPHLLALTRMSYGTSSVVRLDGTPPWRSAYALPNIVCWTPGQFRVAGRMGTFVSYQDDSGYRMRGGDDLGAADMTHGLTQVSAMTATRTRGGLTSLFGRQQSDQAVYWLLFDGDGRGGPPTKITGDVQVGDLLATSTASGVMNLFVLDTFGFIHHTGEHADRPGTWTTCLKLRQDLVFTALVGGSPFTETAEVLARSQTGPVYRIWQEQGGEGWHFDPIEAEATTTVEDVSAYNVQITVYDASDVALANAPVSVRCEEPVILEVNGQSTFFGAGNSWDGTTNSAGQVIVSVPTRSLGVPKLTVTTAGAEVLVDPSAPVRDYLATVDGPTLKAAEVVGNDGKRTPLLGPTAQAPATVEALVKGITAAAKAVPAGEPASSAAPRFFHRLNDHRVASLVSTAQPATPVSASAAPASSWIFEFTAGAPSFRVLSPGERATLATQHAALPSAALFFGLDLSWGDVFDAITSGVASIVTAVADTIGTAVNAALTLVIEGVTYVFNAVVAAAQQALDLIEEMFKTVVDGFEQLYRWLGFIFDWGDIQRSKNAIKYMVNQTIDYGVSVIGVPARVEC